MKKTLGKLIYFKKILNPFKKARKKGYRYLFLLVYFSLMLLGVVLFVINLFIPQFRVCTNLFFGVTTCAPLGIYFVLAPSIPGYVVVVNAIPSIAGLSWYLSFLVVIAASFVFYFLLGLFFDKYTKKDAEERVKMIIAGTFVLLLVVIFVFLR